MTSPNEVVCCKLEASRRRQMGCREEFPRMAYPFDELTHYCHLSFAPDEVKDVTYLDRTRRPPMLPLSGSYCLVAGRRGMSGYHPSAVGRCLYLPERAHVTLMRSSDAGEEAHDCNAARSEKTLHIASLFCVPSSVGKPQQTFP
ncbi:unnamed protein product [Symbiodinium microadriaticum]|nr:unnamed protein product [Symbiodinium microadriaticum]